MANHIGFYRHDTARNAKSGVATLCSLASVKRSFNLTGSKKSLDTIKIKHVKGCIKNLNLLWIHFVNILYDNWNLSLFFKIAYPKIGSLFFSAYFARSYMTINTEK